MRALQIIRSVVLLILAGIAAPKAAVCDVAVAYDAQDYSAYVGNWTVLWTPPDGPQIYGEVVINGEFEIDSVFWERSHENSEREVLQSTRLQAGNLYGELLGPGKHKSALRVRASEGGAALNGRAHWGDNDHGSVVFNRMVPYRTNPKAGPSAQVCCGVDTDDKIQVKEDGKIERGDVTFWVDLKRPDLSIHPGLPAYLATHEAIVEVQIDHPGLNFQNAERISIFPEQGNIRESDISVLWRLSFYATNKARAGPTSFRLNGVEYEFNLNINTVCHSKAAEKSAAEEYCHGELKCSDYDYRPIGLECKRGGAAWKCTCER